MAPVSGSEHGRGTEPAGADALLEVFLDPAGPDVTEIECADGVIGIDRAANRLDAARCASVDRFDANMSYVGDALKSTVAWLLAHTELAPGAAAALVRRARNLRVTPAVWAAYAEGTIGTAKVDALLDVRVGLEEIFAEHEAALVAEIAPLDVRNARYAINQWKVHALASIGQSDDGPEPDPEDENRFHCSKSYEGRHKIDGDLDDISASSLMEAIDARIDEYFRNGAVKRSDNIPRSRLQAWALLDLVGRGAVPGVRNGRPRPSVTVNLDYGDLLGLPIDGVPEIWGRRCELADGTRIPRPTAERLLCTADVTTVLTRTGLHGVMQPLGAAHSNRYPSPNERAALAVRDGGCVFPGCDAPVEWTDAHHIDQWHLGHITELSRLVLLCRFHHHAVHEGGHHLDRAADGTITVERPGGGTQHGTSPPERPPTRFATDADRELRSRRKAANGWNHVRLSLLGSRAA